MARYGELSLEESIWTCRKTENRVIERVIERNNEL
jgi:hypothetical protein